MAKERLKALRYLTGIHALNIECDLLTCGDWHQSALKWENLMIRESDDSVYKEWGIEHGRTIPKHEEKYSTANHIRALLDLLEEGNYAEAQGMKEDFICNDDYNEIVFEKVAMLQGMKNWDLIDAFMGREYKMEWVRYKQGGHIERLAKKP